MALTNPFLHRKNMFNKMKLKRHSGFKEPSTIKNFGRQISNLMVKKFKNTDLYRRFFPETDNIPRHIKLTLNKSERVSPELSQLSNEQNNKKYSVYNFPFKFFYEQFTVFSNFYFLLIAFSQMIPIFKVGFFISYVFPLTFILLSAVIREIKDEILRIMKDREANSLPIKVLSENENIENSENINNNNQKKINKETFWEKKSLKDLKVGDIIKIEEGQKVPTDSLLLFSYAENNSLYLNTDELDGETDWKLRNAINFSSFPTFSKLNSNSLNPSNFNNNNKEEEEKKKDKNLEAKNLIKALLNSQAEINYEKPQKDIYSFNGSISFPLPNSLSSNNNNNNNKNENEKKRKEIKLSLENILWASTSLVSSAGLAIVLYVGKDNRIFRNTASAKTKFGKTEKEISWFMKLMFYIMILCSLTLILGSRKFYNVIPRFIRYLILFSHMIPMSLRLNLDLCKIVNSFVMQKDKDLEGIVVRTSTILEELGRIRYLFSDKTGTLTENVMRFQKLVLRPQFFFTVKGLFEMKGEVFSKEGLEGLLGSYSKGLKGVSEDGGKEEGKRKEKSKKEILEKILFAMALCHNIYLKPSLSNNNNNNNNNKDNNKDKKEEKEEKNKNSFFSNLKSNFLFNRNKDDFKSNFSSQKDSNTESEGKKNFSKDFISNSPDEISIFEICDTLGIKLISRNSKMIQISICGNLKTFEVLHYFPFNSKRKRMSIVLKEFIHKNEKDENDLKENETEKVFILAKGAESTMEKLVLQNSWFIEEVDNLARDGLRTLVYASKTISYKEYISTLQNFFSSNPTEKSDEEVEKEIPAELFERQLEVIGITGVEDRLQEGVQNCLEVVRSAGVKVWVLTGDKAETATCVARSARLIGFSQPLLKITGSLSNPPLGFNREGGKGENFPLFRRSQNSYGGNSFTINNNDNEDFFQYLEDSKLKVQRTIEKIALHPNHALIIDGDALSSLLSINPLGFTEAARACDVVVCCRCTPDQKAEVVRLMNKVTSKNSLAIGDGGNDISMIREASVGVGIIGIEGRQAALTADYAVPKFGHLQKMLLWHGRNTYINISTVSKVVVQRGFLLSFVQYLYSWIYFQVPTSMFGDFLMLNYTGLYTNFAVILLYVDRNIRYRVMILYPELYREMQKGRLLGVRAILVCFAEAIYQGTMILMVSSILFKEISLRLSSIAFTAAIFTFYSNVFLKLQKRSKFIVGAIGISVTLYLGSIFVMPNQFDWRFMMSSGFFLKTVLTTSLSVLPIFFIRKIYEKFYPSMNSKFKFT